MVNIPVKHMNESTIRSDRNLDLQFPSLNGSILIVLGCFPQSFYLCRDTHVYIFAYTGKWKDTVYIVLCIAFFNLRNNSEVIMFQCIKESVN